MAGADRTVRRRQVTDAVGGRIDATTGRETPDVDTSSADYATRFAGPIGEYFLAVQAEAMLKLLRDLPAGSRVLDVGGGHGQVAAPLQRAGYRVTVLGSDPRCFSWRPERFDGCETEAGDLLNLPYPDRSFDAVVSFRLLPHLVDWQRGVSEIARVADRVVVVDYPSTRSVNVLTGLLFPVKKHLEGNTRHYRLFRPREVSAELSGNGWSTDAVVGQFFWPMVVHRAHGRPGLARALESGPRVAGLSRVLGSPLIVRARRG